MDQSEVSIQDVDQSEVSIHDVNQSEVSIHDLDQSEVSIVLPPRAGRRGSSPRQTGTEADSAALKSRQIINEGHVNFHNIESLNSTSCTPSYL